MRAALYHWAAAETIAAQEAADAMESAVCAVIGVVSPSEAGRVAVNGLVTVGLNLAAGYRTRARLCSYVAQAALKVGA